MKILVDMNLSPRWVEFLANAGIEAIHWAQVGAGGAHDSDVLGWAAEHDYVVVTNDLDFGAILAATRHRRPSVLQLRSDVLTPEVMGSAVLSAIAQAHQELSDGALVSIEPARARLRVLPLRS